MKFTRVYCPERSLSIGADWLMDQRGMRHIVQVMRLRKGDQFVVFNESQSGEFIAEIIATTKKEARVKVIEAMPGVEPSSLHMHLAQAISRGERMDYAIQKAVELGVSAITPVLAERCGVKISKEREEKRMAHWQGVAISAAEQSGRCNVPIIHPVCRYDEWCQSVQADKKWVAMPGRPATNAASDDVQSVALLIGPEGGLTDAEGDVAVEHGFESIGLGPRVLRTETAPVVALTLAQHYWGDLR